MPQPTIAGGEYYVFGLSIRSSVNAYPAWRDIPLLSGEISIKLVMNIHHIHHASGHCCRCFQGQRWKVKVMTSIVNLYWRWNANRRCGVDAEFFYYYNPFINSTVSPSRGTAVTSLAAGVCLLSPTVRGA